MMNLDRVDLETREIEQSLNTVYRDQHHAVIQAHGAGPVPLAFRRLRWLSASIWSREQGRDPGAAQESMLAPEIIREELYAEIRAIASDYGTLCLEGIRLFLAILACWMVLQDHISVRLSLWIFSGLALSCLILYPIGVYTYWNRTSIHPFKGLKLILGAFGALVAEGGIYMISLMERQNPLFEGAILPAFNFTEFLILANLVVLLSFIIHYRRLNMFGDVAASYHKHLISLSGLSLAAQEEIRNRLRDLEAIPLKTHTKRRIKTGMIEEYTRVGLVEPAWEKRFIRANCIDMNWMYWSGSVAQWAILILMISKFIWACDTGLMVSADYFRQGLTTGMVLGAILMSAAGFCPMNWCFRELLYQGAPFSLKQAWLLMGLAVLCVSVVLLSGLVPSRFIWGIPVNPAPHPWGLSVLLGLAVLLQFFKTDPRFQGMESA